MLATNRRRLSNAMHYLDHNATSPLRPECLAAVTHALGVGGNPSSVHASGRAARAIVEEAREKVAALAGAKAGEVIFTSGATEANNLALFGAVEGSLAKARSSKRAHHPRCSCPPSSTLRCWPRPKAGRALSLGAA